LESSSGRTGETNEIGTGDGVSIVLEDVIEFGTSGGGKFALLFILEFNGEWTEVTEENSLLFLSSF
jgi:hypothetical protein